MLTKVQATIDNNENTITSQPVSNEQEDTLKVDNVYAHPSSEEPKHKTNILHKEPNEKPFRRVMRYTLAILLIVAASFGAVVLMVFISEVFNEDRGEVQMTNITLDEYVINEPPDDPRRSHVRMKPGAHPEAGYIADESVLIRVKEEDETPKRETSKPAESEAIEIESSYVEQPATTSHSHETPTISATPHDRLTTPPVREEERRNTPAKQEVNGLFD